MPTTIPGISISKAREILIKTDKMIKEFPEVQTVFGKIGRSETATDPAPLSMIETTVLLKDRSEWRDGMTMDKLKAELYKKISLPGMANYWTMPIKARIEMLATGIKTSLGVKIMGDDLTTLERLTKELEGHISKIEDVSFVTGDRVEGANYIIYDIDREKAGLYGLHVADIQKVLTSALGGRAITEIISGQYRWSANIRYNRKYRESMESLNNIYIPIPGGGQVPVTEVAKIKIEKGPGLIKSANARKTSWVYIDTKSSDIGGLAERIKDHLEEIIHEKKITWPAGYTYEISGQYEQLELANNRMKILIPVVLLIVFIILFIQFKNISHPPLGHDECYFLCSHRRPLAHVFFRV